MRSYAIRLRARQHEVDVQGHVNNVAYLHYIEEVAVRHAEALGFDFAACQRLGGLWVVRQHTITYRSPARSGDELEIATTVANMTRIRVHRHTVVKQIASERVLVECATEWVWINAEGRPQAIPAVMQTAFADLVAASDG